MKHAKQQNTNSEPRPSVHQQQYDRATARPSVRARHAQQTQPGREAYYAPYEQEPQHSHSNQEQPHTQLVLAGRGQMPHRQNRFIRYIQEWLTRLLGVVSDRSFNQEEQYSTHCTKRDYIWNSVGTGLWSMVFPALSIVVTWVLGADLAGVFALAFVTAKVLMFVANYGMRTFQVSDIEEKYSFKDYQLSRYISCAVMMVLALLYCSFQGYEFSTAAVFFGMFVYKMVDGLADVYEGRLQQKDKLYLAGISLGFRSLVVIVIPSIVLVITRNLAVCCIAMGVVALASLVVLTIPLAILETDKSKKGGPSKVLSLLKQCFPVFVALFLYALIDNMPKFVMGGMLSYDNQLYFNVLYFPAQFILMTVGSIYKPLLVKMSDAWANPQKRRGFDLTIVAILAIIVVLTLLTVLVMDWVGLSVFSVLYGLDFTQFRNLSMVMLAAGGVAAAIDFLYQVITILRRQKAVMKLYLITFVFSIMIPVLLIGFTGLTGAVMSYLLIMSILFVLLVVEYVGIRMGIFKERKKAVAENA